MQQVSLILLIIDVKFNMYCAIELGHKNQALSWLALALAL
jgi:hypothetical protein